MNYLELMKERHSVRQYKDISISKEDAQKLKEKIEEVNKKSGLDFKLVLNDKFAFGGLLPKYGSFRNANNYIICAGDKVPDFEEKYGYYGEELVIYAQSLGLNTCWVGATVSKKVVKLKMKPSETLGCVIAIGYGEN